MLFVSDLKNQSLRQLSFTFAMYARTHAHIYEGRSINKLQNSIILVIFKVWKIQIYVLYGILCWVPAESFITMTSL